MTGHGSPFAHVSRAEIVVLLAIGAGIAGACALGYAAHVGAQAIRRAGRVLGRR